MSKAPVFTNAPFAQTWATELAEAKITPDPVQPHALALYIRNSWHAAGVNTFAQPPAQDEDSLMLGINMQSPFTGVISRRWAYRTFHPQLDSGSGDGS